MTTIQTNPTGTRHINVSEENFQAIEKYSLLDGLVLSNGIVDDKTLEKLQQNARAFIIRNDRCDDLATLCREVIFHDNMKVYGLRELIAAYVAWSEEKAKSEE